MSYLQNSVLRKRGLDTSHFSGKDQFIQRVKDCLQLARDNFDDFNFDDDDVTIVFFKTGATAGYFKRRTLDHVFILNLEFNTHAIKTEWDDMYNDTIPHEVAHLVNFVLSGNRNLGPSHGLLWQRIAKKLGCTAKRTHNYDMTAVKRKPRVRNIALYQASCGTIVEVSMVRHNRFKDRFGYNVSLRSTGGRITASDYIGMKH